MRYFRAASIAIAGMLTPLVSASAGTLTLDLTLDRAVAMSGPVPVAGSARVILRGVSALGVITVDSAYGELRALRATLPPGGVGATSFQLSLADPLVAMLSGQTFRGPASFRVRPVSGRLPPSLTNGTGATTLGLVVPVLLSGLDAPGSAAALLSLQLGPAVLAQLSGREVGRAFSTGQAPEPPGAALLLLALLALWLRPRISRAEHARSPRST